MIWLTCSRWRSLPHLVLPAPHPPIPPTRPYAVYIFGGASAGGPLGDLWAFTLGAGWEELTAPQPRTLLPRWDHVSVAWDSAHEGKVLAIIGGQSGAQLNDDVHVYSSSTKSWSKHLALGTQVRRHAANAAVQIRRRIYLVGGLTQQTTTSAVHRTSDVHVHNFDEALEPPNLASATASTLMLSWRLSTSYAQQSAGSSCSTAAVISEYELQGIDSQRSFVTLYRGEQTSFTVQGLESGVPYSFRIRGWGLGGYIGWSAVTTYNTSVASTTQVTGEGCASPAWHSVLELDPAAGCPGDWVQILPQPGAADDATPPVAVCSRGYVRDVSQASAILAQGWIYSAIRGQVSAQVMGSPDAMRAEPFRGEASIDDAYLDGISLARWTPRGRVHMASYAAGLSYTARHFSYYQLGNCVCELSATGRTTLPHRTRDIQPEG